MKTLLSSIEILDRLIQYPTVSKDSNLELISFIGNYLDGFGVESELVYNESKSKANLFATIGERDKRGVIFSGHTDVVPVDGQEWNTDPFKLVSKNERLFGRGVCDMKGFIAVALAAVPEIKRANKVSRGPVHFAFSYDEEIGCVGVHSMLDLIKKKNIGDSLCIVGEPTSMRPVSAHKGKSSFRCHVKTQPFHSSMSPIALNSIELSAEIILYIKEVMLLKKSEINNKSLFEFPYITSNVGVINGGAAINIIPENCSFDVEFRYPPGWDSSLDIEKVSDYVNDIGNRIVNKFPAGHTVWEELNSYPAFSANNDKAALEMAKSLLNCNEDLAVNYGTEAGLFSKSGISSVVCGPGSIEQAHKANEFVELQQLSLCEKFIASVIDRDAN